MTSAVVARFPSLDGGGVTFERLWRCDGPAGAGGVFHSLLVAAGSAVYAAGSWDVAGGSVRGIVRRLDPASPR